jgi:hypothetical protein
MKGWKGTKGLFIYENDVYTDTHSNYTCHIKNENDKIIVSAFGNSVEEVRDNALLMVNAGNTIQKCGLLPSELLEQRDELLVFVKRIQPILKDRMLYNSAEGANELINKITNND